MKQTPSHQALDILEDVLTEKRNEWRRRKLTYTVPSLWLTDRTPSKRAQADPFSFYLKAVRAAKAGRPLQRPGTSGGEWTRDAVVYNMFVRATAAFDHDRSGKLELPVNSDGFRETGTFLKALAMLPYIKRLGANTVHLLPITAIGRDGNKGTLGSPYAIRNPYELDENLSEPLLGLDVKTQFKAFVEAAHKMGIRVVVEFVFRTAAKDSDWVRSHPEWFYWIKEEIEARGPHHHEESRYGSPLFTRGELEHIHHAVRDHRFDQLLPPHQTYRDFFTPAPPADTIVLEDGRYIGIVQGKQRVKIPGAFSDWPPDDNQPPWGDVTYLRMYTHPDFNYIAYNTIRMYDSRLTQPQYVNRSLWDMIVGIIPYYQQQFRIDGVMIDMGHALPMALKSEIVRAARANDPDFAFWEEDFSINRRSKEEGYNAVFGYLWIDEHHPSRMKTFFRRCATEGFPIWFFATPENHNTPRAASRPGGATYAQWAWVVNCFLPAIPFIHSGFELAEKYPINTGLDFSIEQLKHYPSEKLPLFSEHCYDWLRKKHLTRWIAKVSALRQKYREIVVNPDPQTFALVHCENEHVLGFVRLDILSRKAIAVVGNTNFSSLERSTVRVDTSREYVVDLLTGKKMNVRNREIRVRLSPGQCMVFEI
jgi:hypothetical protein